jgi:hypothetical protein
VLKSLLFLLSTAVYNWLARLFKRIYFTEDEIHYLVDILDSWAETYRHIATEAEDDEVHGLHEDMSVAMEVRDKLWRQLNA